MKTALCAAKSSAFTLIETLLTVSLFALLMTALLGSLFAGTRSWSKADAQLTRQAQLRFALGELTWDLEHLHFDPEGQMAPFVVSADEAGDPQLTLLCVDERASSPLQGSVCQRTWSLKDNRDSLEWVRESQAYISGSPVGEPAERTMLTGVKKISYLYYGQGRWGDSWEDQGSHPDLVQIHAELGGSPISRQWSTAVLALTNEKLTNENSDRNPRSGTPAPRVRR